MAYRRIASFKSHVDFVSYLESLGIDLPCDDAVIDGHHSPLSAPIQVDCGKIGNRFCILPMARRPSRRPI